MKQLEQKERVAPEAGLGPIKLQMMIVSKLESGSAGTLAQGSRIANYRNSDSTSWLFRYCRAFIAFDRRVLHDWIDRVLVPILRLVFKGLQQRLIVLVFLYLN